MQKIKNLGAVKELYKFHFLSAIYYLNKKQPEDSLNEVDQAISLKADYFRAICLKTFVESELKTIDYETALGRLIDKDEKPIQGSGNDKDNSYIFNLLGYISMSFKKNDEAIKFFSKANGLTPSKSLEAAIGIAYFQKAVEKSNGIHIYKKDVDLETLNIAISIFNELYFIDDAEVRKSIRIQISPIYFRCLFLADNFGVFNNIFEDIKNYCPYEKSELYKMKAFSEAMEGSVQPETLKELDPEEQKWIYFIELMNNEKYEPVINELSPVIWTLYKDSDKHHGMLLHAYLGVNDLKSFVKHFKTYKAIGKKSEIIDMMEGLYYEKTGDLGKAERILRDITFKNSDYLLYYELVSFYERNRLNDEEESLFEDLFKTKRTIIEPRKDRFYFKYFMFLFRNKKISKAIEVFETIKMSDLGELNYQKISAEVNYLKGYYRKAASEYEALYEKTKDLEDLMRSLEAYLSFNNLEKSEEIIKLLERKNYKKKSTMYAMYSNIELLKGDTDKSFEYASKALEADKDEPSSNVHQFYVQKSFRCNKDEGKQYVHEYAYNYPTHQKWLKSYKGLEVDEQGNNKLSKEFLDVIKSLQEQFINYKNAYNTGLIGITTLSKAYSQTIPEIINWRYYYGIKIKITSGNIQEAISEYQSFSKHVIIDSFGLYILAEIGYLDLLKSFDKVYITYSTIAFLQQTILSIEDSKAREVLKFIENEINIEIVYPDYKLSVELEEKFKLVFNKDQIDSGIYSHVNCIPYIYSDPYFKHYMDGFNSKFMSIVSLIRAFQENHIINTSTLSAIIVKLKRYKYDFINFTANDIYNTALKTNFELSDDLMLFFNLEKENDFPSFVRVYSEFLKMIYGKIDKDKFDKFFDLYIHLFDKYSNKSQYYYQALGIMFSQDIKEFLNAIIEGSLLDIVAYRTSLSIDLINSYEMNRLLYILIYCHGALVFALQTFKDNEADYEYYSNRLRGLIKNIPEKDIDLIVQNGLKNFDELYGLPE